MNDLMNRTIEKVLLAEAKKQDAAIQEYLDRGYQLGDLMLKRWYDGTWKIHVITPEERWLDWHSNNHGYGS